MPKMRSNSGAKKRFKISPSGRVKHAQMGKAHILTKKPRKRIRNLNKMTTLEGKQARTIKGMIQ